MKIRILALLAICISFVFSASATTFIMHGTLIENSNKAGEGRAATFTVKCASGQGVCATVTVNDGLSTIINCAPVIPPIPVGLPIAGPGFSGYFVSYGYAIEPGAEVYNWEYTP